MGSSTTPDPAFAAVLRHQARSNRSAQKYDDLFAGHREHLTTAILNAVPQGRPGRLALLGAGACQDVDLAKLAAAFAEIHLIDLDRAAVDTARGRQTPAVRAKLVAAAPVDLSGVISHLERWKTKPPALSAFDLIAHQAVARITEDLHGPFDVVVSCCLATQLSLALTEVLGLHHTLLHEIRKRVLGIHLRSLAALAAGGGTALFVSDVCSNDTYPLDDLPEDQKLSAVFSEISRTGNVFFGSDPAVVGHLLRKDAFLAARVSNLRSLDPWLWQVGPERIFLVYGLAFTSGAG